MKILSYIIILSLSLISLVKSSYFVKDEIIVTNENDVNLESKTEWNNCSSPDSILIVDDLKLVPDPPKRGNRLTVLLEGFLLRDVEVGSRIKITIRYGSLVIYKDDMDLCSLIKCPAPRGEITATYSVDIFSYTLKGTYRAEAYAYEPDEQEIACITGKTELV